MQECRTIGLVASLGMLCACAGTHTVRSHSQADRAAQNMLPCFAEADARFSGQGANCTSYGRSYSSDDIYRTGATTLGQALRLLDADITLR